MILNEQHYESIERYLRNEMSPSEKESFLKEVEENEELKKGFELEKKIYEGVVSETGSDISNVIKEVQGKLDHEGFFNKTNRTMNRRIIEWVTAAAAMIVILLAISFLFTMENEKKSPDAIFAEYYKLEDANLKEKLAKLSEFGFAEEEASRKDSLAEAISKIDAGEYEEARTVLNQLITQYPEDKEAFFYAGLNQLQLGNYASAISKLQIARSAEDKNISDRARYYFALCSLMIKDGGGPSIARREFQRIANDDTSEFQDIAKDILSSLETDS